MRIKPQVFIRARAMTGLRPLVHSLGGDVEALMSKFELDAAVTLSCPNFGLRLSAYQDIGVLGSLAFIPLHARTVRDGDRGHCPPSAVPQPRP